MNGLIRSGEFIEGVEAQSQLFALFQNALHLNGFDVMSLHSVLSDAVGIENEQLLAGCSPFQDFINHLLGVAGIFVNAFAVEIEMVGNIRQRNEGIVPVHKPFALLGVYSCADVVEMQFEDIIEPFVSGTHGTGV